ncbi:MAG: HIRAN domain-containing protein [Reyranella sp.]
MELLLAALAVGVVVWLIARRNKPTAASVPDRPRVPPSKSTTIEHEIRRPTLPQGIEPQIVAALQRGDDPDEEWMRGPNDGVVRLMPYEGRFQSIAGETFSNPDGVPRQTILRRATPGTEVFLVPEPTNQYDSSAVAVYLDAGGGDTAQIGYLPRGHSSGGDVAAGKVLAWLARVASREPGAPIGATLYLVTKNS